jgi:hypothetical protein
MCPRYGGRDQGDRGAELSGWVKSTALRAIIKQVTEKSPQRAMSLVDQLESVSERETAMKELLGPWGGWILNQQRERLPLCRRLT